jgi:thiamine pyrophosphokinase
MPAEEVVPEELVVVVAGGELPATRALDGVPAGVPVVVADRGLEHALRLGLAVTQAVGDFDSASPESVAAAEAGGIAVVRHPADKDATDLELALDAAAALEPRRILVLAGGGGRLDHLLATVLLLGSERYREMELDAHVGGARVHVVRGERTLEGEPGELVTLLSLGGRAEGVRTEGLRYPLEGETLEAGSSRGVSNRFLTAVARVQVERGVLLAIRPGAAT